jgi:hypothetical protein
LEVVDTFSVQRTSTDNEGLYVTVSGSDANAIIESFYQEDSSSQFGYRKKYDGSTNLYQEFIHDNSATGTEVYRVDRGTKNTSIANGNVGIGMTSPGKKLDVVSTSGTSIVQSLRNPSTSWNQYALTRYGTEAADFRYMDFGYFRGNNNEATRGLVVKSQANATLVTFLDAGNVGIGTTDPVNKLNVNGDIGYIGVIGQGSIYGNTGNSSFSTMQLYDPATGYTTLNNQSYGYYFNTSGGTKVTILNGGNVGINVTNPNEKLHVDGNIRLDGSVFFSSSSVFNKILLNGTDMEIWSGALFPSIDITSGGLLKFGAYALSGAGTPTKLLGVDGSGNVLTTTASSIPGGPYLPLAGGTMTGDINMENGERIRWTDNPSGGLSIHSNSSNSFIQHTGTGYFQISNDCTGGIQTEILITNAARNQAVRFQADNGNPEGTTSCEVRDYFFLDGASATYASGASTAVYTVFPDLSYIALGTGKDLQIYHDGTDSYIDDAGTGDLRIRSNFLKIEKYTGETMATFNDDNAVTLYYNNSSRLVTTLAGVDLAGSVSINNPSNNESILNIQDDGTNGHIAFENSSEITGIITSGTDFINFRTGDGVSMSDSPVLTLFPSRIGINTTSPNSNVALDIDGRVLIKDSTGVADLYLGNYATANHFRFHTNNADTYFDMNCGNIYWRDGGSTRYTFFPSTANMTVNGTITQNSDARVKENIVEIGDCISKVQAMKGVYYNRTDFNTEATKVGVIAQDVEAVLPELIIESPEDGLKSVAYSELTAVLINAIKEQQEIIEDLKTRITKLEN